jgi:hypothetical protein
MSVIVLDAGNSIIKAKIARRERSEIAFPHAIKPLTEVEYTGIVTRAGKQSSSHMTHPEFNLGRVEGR